MLAPNTLLQDRYLVVNLLGQGGMGAVYQATDRKFGNAVALKETFYSDLQLRKAFSHEARLLNRLRHAALPVVTDYFAIGERQFLVMQYIPGKDLEELLAERKAQGQGVFLTSQVLLWADQLLDALEYLHSQKPPIIHRDIKPQNLKLTPRGEVILLDFGLAKGIVTHQSQASQSIRGYTPNYASLEQIRGTGTDSRSDIYSIGATIYHLLTGEMPQDAMTRIAAILMGQPDPLRPIAVLNPDVPAMIAAVIEKAMSPHPDQRYSSAAAMRQALRNSANNIPPVNPHRDPTLTDEPMKSQVAAVGTRLRAGAAVMQQQAAAAAAVKAVKSSDPDHVILLLDDVKQKPTKDGMRRPPSKPKQSKAASRPTLRKRAIWYGATVIILIALTLCGVAYKTLQTRPNLLTDVAEWATTTQANVSGNVSGPALAIPMRVEALRYYLELASSGNKNSNELTRATGLMPLEGGAKFKFHFKPKEDGYLYILALGKNGVPQTFLTSQPMPASGVTTNWSAASADFQFPDGGQWFMIQKDADTTPFTVIFSKTPLTAPAFLSSQSGRDLTAAEQQELMEMKRLYAANAPTLMAMADENQPAVAVHVPAERAANEPVIFDISINRKK
jgi:serine/threonine protein kinase